ncbi:hypothetical protein AAF712_005123 [Marasmius tenuissimus]|uniref:Uncharacterized protein n=1 Tax=Marasmius tenuissimus TaxID=585030 RepID=A0ABR3A3K6_9AGAR
MFDYTTERTPVRPALFGEVASLRSFTLKARANTFSGSSVDLPTISKRPTTRSFGKARPKSSIPSILSFGSKRATVFERNSVAVEEGGSWRHGFFFGGKGSRDFQSPTSKRRPSYPGAGKKTFLKRLSTVLRKSSVPLTDDTTGPFSRRDSVIQQVEEPDAVSSLLTEQVDRENKYEEAELQARERLTNFRFGGLEKHEPPDPTSLPSPCEGLFESSARNSLPRLDTNLEHVFPVPLPLSPLLAPLVTGPNVPIATSTRSSSPAELTDEVQLSSWEDESQSPSLTRSPSESSDESSSSTPPTSLESVLCMVGCTLKSSTSPKTWAGGVSCVRRLSVTVESPAEKGFWEHPSLTSSMFARGPSESDDDSSSSTEDLVLTERPPTVAGPGLYSHARAKSDQLPWTYPPSFRMTSTPRRALSLTHHYPLH